MKTIDVQFGQTNIKINCEDEKKVHSLVESVNKLIEKLRSENKQVIDSKILFLATIVLQAEIEELKQSLNTIENKHRKEVDLVYKQVSQTIKYILT